MAKSKKTTDAKEQPKPAAPAKPEAKKAPAKKPAAAKTKSATPALPTVEMNLAAQTAARMIAAKAANNASPAAPKKETSTFKQLKDSLNKGHSTSVHSVLNNSMSPDSKKSNQPFREGRQTSHNQTFGSDASKAFVPRRTSGG